MVENVGILPACLASSHSKLREDCHFDIRLCFLPPNKVQTKSDYVFKVVFTFTAFHYKFLIKHPQIKGQFSNTENFKLSVP